MRLSLPSGDVVLIDREDYPLVAAFRWYAVRRGRTTYAATRRAAGNLLMHRVILGAKRGVLVDHRNHNGLDNRRRNLRLCTPAQSALNTRAHRDSATGLKGVTPYAGKFMANACLNGQRVYLGLHETAEAARRAYVAWAKGAHGEFFAG